MCSGPGQAQVAVILLFMMRFIVAAAAAAAAPSSRSPRRLAAKCRPPDSRSILPTPGIPGPSRFASPPLSPPPFRPKSGARATRVAGRALSLPRFPARFWGFSRAFDDSALPPPPI
ncbi:hypothetical protein NL676_003953 [Syzygium grande]|nr:hypothetical protein NL676_003953 [Syzygium grande]